MRSHTGNRQGHRHSLDPDVLTMDAQPDQRGGGNVDSDGKGFQHGGASSIPDFPPGRVSILASPRALRTPHSDPRPGPGMWTGG